MNLHHFNEHWLGIFGTVVVIISYIPQITHLLKEHCGEGVSLSAYGLWMAASLLLCGYAIVGSEQLFSVLQGYHAAACGIILLLATKFRRAKCPLHRKED